MDGYARTQKSTLVERLKEEPLRLVLVSGPRQTGKTTLVLQAVQEIQSEMPSRYLAVDDPSGHVLPFDPSSDVETRGQDAISEPIDVEPDALWLTQQWEISRRQAMRLRACSVLVLDEIQKIPNWSETVKGLWDRDRQTKLPLHVVLTGSAPLLMQQGLSESLAGRFEVNSVTHWSFDEMSTAFGLNIGQFVYFGGYPGAAHLIQEQERWSAYISESIIEPNIERDILSLQRVDKPALLRRLFELATAYSGQILSYNKMLGQLTDAGNTTTLARYLDLLSNAGLVTGLSEYSGSEVKRKSSSPKLIVHNTALMTAGSGYSFEQANADRTYWGRLVESAVGAHLLNTKSRSQKVYYWREGDQEIDFILKQADKIRAIEVKSGNDTVQWTVLNDFQDRFGALDPLIVGERGVPLSDFLLRPASEWLEP